MQLSKPHLSHPGYRTRPAHDVFPEDLECVLQATSTHGAIYIGNLQAAENLQTLQKYEISSLLTACKNIHIRHPKQYVAYSLYIPGQDHQNYELSLHFETAVNFIHSSLKQTNILVHCMAGVSRSVTLVIAYLIKHKNMSFQQAFKAVQTKRRKINPNPGFIRQLQTYEQKISRPHYSSYSQYDRYTTNNASFVDKNKNNYLNNQNLAQDSLKYRPTRHSDNLKLDQRYKSYAKMMANANLQLSTAKAYNPEKEQCYRPRTSYQNKQEHNSSFFKQSCYYNPPTKVTREQRDPRMSATLTQITNQSTYTTNRNSNIDNLSRDLDDRIAKIKQKYYEGREVNLNRSLVSSEDQRAGNQASTKNTGIARQSFNRSVYNSSSAFKSLTRKYY